MKTLSIKSIVLWTLIGLSLVSTYAYNIQMWSPIQYVGKIYLTPNGEFNASKATITLDGSNGTIKAKSIFVNNQSVATTNYVSGAVKWAKSYTDLAIKNKADKSYVDGSDNKIIDLIIDTRSDLYKSVENIKKAQYNVTVSLPKPEKNTEQDTKWTEDKQAWDQLCIKNGYVSAVDAKKWITGARCVYSWNDKEKKFVKNGDCWYDNKYIFWAITCVADINKVIDENKINIPTCKPWEMLTSTDGKKLKCTKFKCGDDVIAVVNWTAYKYSTKIMPDGHCWTSQNMRHPPKNLKNEWKNWDIFKTWRWILEQWDRVNWVVYTWRAAMGCSDDKCTTENLTNSVCWQLGKGWHLPSDNEWKWLETSLGCDDESIHWKRCFALGTFGNQMWGLVTFFPWVKYYSDWKTQRKNDWVAMWTATPNNKGTSWDRSLRWGEFTVWRFHPFKSRWLSVICIKN